jgi:MarR family transcriptional regulator, organic hydroperoxide resistance regulator
LVVEYKEIEENPAPPALDAAEPGAAVAEVLAAFGELLVAQRRLRGRDAQHPGELSFAQLRVLAALERGDSCPTGQLAEKAGVSPATVTGMLDNLEQMGIVTRVRSAEDRRVVLTRLTDEGRRLRDEKRREVRGAFEQALSSLGPRDLAAAPRILRLLAGAMETM